MFITVEEINKNISDPTFVLKAEQEYMRNIKGIANAIAENRFQRPIVLLSGPSGSGKTTTAFLLEKEIFYEVKKLLIVYTVFCGFVDIIFGGNGSCSNATGC